MKEEQRILAIYGDYEVMPYISPERDLATWLEEVKILPNKKVPKRNMVYLEENILPGHIIILWRTQFGTYTTEIWTCKYFEDMYGIDEPKERQWLIDTGYMEIESAFDSLRLISGPVLKFYLKEKEVKGLSKLKKDELMYAIRQHFTEEELATKFSIRGYRLTKEGEELLARHPEVIDRHPKKNI